MDAVTEGRKCLLMLIGIEELVTKNYGLVQREMSKVQAMDYSELKARIVPLYQQYRDVVNDPKVINQQTIHPMIDRMVG